MDDNKGLFSSLIMYAHGMGATDVHVSPGLVPDVVVRGKLYALGDEKLVSADQIIEWARWLCEHQYPLLDSAAGAVDGVATVGELRVRVAFRRQRGGVALTARLLPLRPPQLSDLDVHPDIVDLIHRPNGLVVVSGPTGAGKSTLLAALVNEVNTHQSKHVMTIEDPVEFLHPQGSSRISQREVGMDVGTFAAALRAAVRARPDIIVVGEMRDADTARAALDAASKGQLVLTTSHAGSAADALEGLVGMFPAEEQHAAAGRVATVLQGVVAQRLVPGTEPNEVVAVRELLLAHDAITGMIRKSEFGGIYNALAPKTAINPGFRMEDDLLRKVAAGRVSVDTAMLAANQRTDLAAMLEQRAINNGGRTA